MIRALTLLLCCQLAGEFAVRLGGLPVPGPVFGLLLLFALLVIRRGSDAELQATANGMLQHLSLLFVPAGVGVIVHVERVGAEFAAIAAALLLSTAATLAVSALVFRLVARALDLDSDPP